jgi:hypothetical protein
MTSAANRTDDPGAQPKVQCAPGRKVSVTNSLDSTSRCGASRECHGPCERNGHNDVELSQIVPGAFSSLSMYMGVFKGPLGGFEEQAEL